MNKKDIVRLAAKERRMLREVVKKLDGPSQKARRAQMLLKADAAVPAWTDERIAEAFDSRTRTPVPTLAVARHDSGRLDDRAPSGGIR
jgi:hypothetical protein